MRCVMTPPNKQAKITVVQMSHCIKTAADIRLQAANYLRIRSQLFVEKVYGVAQQFLRGFFAQRVLVPQLASHLQNILFVLL